MCAVLGCGVEELLIAEPEALPAPATPQAEPAAAAGQDRAVKPRTHSKRSLPPR
jgi:hypothetical protein